MYRALLVLFAGCGLGVGAVQGPSREYENQTFAGFFVDPDGNYSDASGKHYSPLYRFTGWSQSSAGALLGSRRGTGWSRFGDERASSVDTQDYELTGYYKGLSLGAGYTTESSHVMAGDIGYHGWFAELSAGIMPGPIYLAASIAAIAGSTYLQRPGEIGNHEQDANGIRPGVRVAFGILRLGPVAIRPSFDLRYLMSPEVDIDGTPRSYGGWTWALAFNFVL